MVPVAGQSVARVVDVDVADRTVLVLVGLCPSAMAEEPELFAAPQPLSSTKQPLVSSKRRWDIFLSFIKVSLAFFVCNNLI